MQGYAPSRTGLKPTLRQLMIVILWSALLSAAVRPLLRFGVIGFRVDFDCLMIPLLAGSMPLPLLILLLRLCDTRGPVQDWYRACCTASGSILSGILFLLQDPVCYVLTGKTSLTFPLSPILAAVFFLVGVIQLRSIWPKRCLNCGCRDVISVVRPARVLSRRLINTGKDGWCRVLRRDVREKGYGCLAAPGTGRDLNSRRFRESALPCLRGDQILQGREHVLDRVSKESG